MSWPASVSKPIATLVLLMACLGGCAGNPHSADSHAIPSSELIDAEVRGMMQETGARGLALAVVDGGQVTKVASYGHRNAKGEPLALDSILYGASLTKTAFAYLVLQLADAGIVDLDKPISQYLPKPLPDHAEPQIKNLYARWSDLQGEERWKSMTLRMLLSHASGFANFGFLEPDGRLRIHFDPGTRYAYSGDGIMLAQFVLEKGLGLDLGLEMKRRLFEPLGMGNTSLMWRGDFANRSADGWTTDGKSVPHDARSKVRAAGSMDTTIADMALLAAAMARGDLLSPTARAELSRAQLAITSASQFPTLQTQARPGDQLAGLAAGLGVVVFDGPQGHGYFKGGHNDSTGNMLVCLESKKRCVVILGNDLRAEAAIPYLADFILGNPGVPWRWEYGRKLFWKPAQPLP